MKMNHVYKTRQVLLLSGLLALAPLACDKAPKLIPQTPPTKVILEAKASATVNRDTSGEPLSVVVRTYYLKDKTEFSKLAFDLLAGGRTDQELLGSEYIGRSEYVVVPGSNLTETMDLPPGTRYVGVVGFFRKPDPNYWRFLVKVEDLKPTKEQKKRLKLKGRDKGPVSIELQDCYLSLTSCKPEPIPGQPLDAKPDCGGQAEASTPPKP
ncbi:type VI secretion system lipoprotein TssJ [Holophaga foetida]|uniref:type VI secretion system lipoprotein TssJ n=1 Tax=Holophaga foetida TaxID=35839 RepID=UPI0002472A70|nr:type VI secretion system lipoprotein TssJ [Holophaga foetida]